MCSAYLAIFIKVDITSHCAETIYKWLIDCLAYESMGLIFRITKDVNILLSFTNNFVIFKIPFHEYSFILTMASLGTSLVLMS